LLSVPRKVFAHVLLACLDPLFHSSRRPHQSGFTRSTLDAILALKLLSELHCEFQKPLRVTYVDLKSAFDSVDRKALWLALKGKGIPPTLRSLIEELYSGTSARIRIGRSFSKRFTTVSSVCQSCVLAPALFNLAIDYIMEHVSCKVGIHIRSNLFTDLNYAMTLHCL